MVAQHVCYSELPKGLDFLCSVYTNHPYYSDYDFGNDDQTWTYNCYDSCITFEIATVLEQEMKELGVYDFYREHAHPTMISLARVGNRGVLIDLAARNRIKIESEKHLEEIKQEFLILPGVRRELNPNSPKQVKELLYEELKIKPVQSRTSRSSTTNEQAIETCISRYPQYKRILELILDYRGTSKLISTFLSSELNKEGRLETSYNATGTVTGRISSSTTIEGLGGNLQQVPRTDFRRIFISGPGNVLIKADLSQAESRVVAYLAKILRLIERFEDPAFDIHRWNASLIFDASENAITKDQRQSAKHCLHSANYQGGPNAAMKHAKTSYQVAKHAIEKYVGALPEMRSWWNEVEMTIRRTRTLRTPLGRMRIFFGRFDMTTFRSATAQVPQSTVGDIINKAVYVLENELPEDCHVILQVHDEVVIEAKTDKLDECCRIIKKALEIPLKFPSIEKPLIIPSEISHGLNWWDQTKWQTS
jgi:DNA polymerase-1